MGTRLELHAELLTVCPNVYFQPPSGFLMKYPCIVYNKTGVEKVYANGGIYRKLQEYGLTVMDSDPDSTLADELESLLGYCAIGSYFTVDNLNHTTLTLYY